MSEKPIIKDALKDITETARGLRKNIRALSIILLTYIALLGAMTLFILTREATIKDLLVTLTTLIAVPALFFLLQAMCVSYTDATSARVVIKESLAIIRRVAIVTIPFIVIGVALYLMLDKIDSAFTPAIQKQTLKTLAREGESWQHVVSSTVRLMTFGIVLPLTCIHLWIAVRRQDLRQVFGTIKPILSKAFALRSIKTYVIGFGLFGLLPYILISVRTPSERAWLEISMLSTRLILALILMLIGWVITVGALQRGARAEG